MKKIYLIAIFVIYTITKLCGQEISTDPNNPVNEERTDLVNQFNWMDLNWSVYHPAPGGGYTDGAGGPFLVANPYYRQTFLYQKHFNLSGLANTSIPPSQFVDFVNIHPRNGWELLKKHDGFRDDNGALITDPLDQRIGPYIVLYNRYTGKLRALASFKTDDLADKAVTTMKFHTEGGLEFSALFNAYGETSQPLDQRTNVIEIAESSLGVPVNGTDFISADFQMSYDPCTCNHDSDILFEYSTLNSADILLDGRLIGISEQLNASGNSPLLNRQDFLTQIYKDDNFTVNGGMLTYNNINDLIEKYKQPSLSASEKAGLDVWKAAFTSLVKLIDKKIGFDLLSAGVKFISGEVNPSHKVPNISFIEAEMVLRGTLTDSNPIPNATARISTPGSLGSSTDTWEFYPAYNKPLGLFALLETPSAVVSQNNVDIARYYCQGTYEGTATFKRIKLLTNSIKYTFNPNSDVNVENTKIYAALVVESIEDPSDDLTDYLSMLPQYTQNAESVATLKSFTNTETGKSHIKKITRFVPIENLGDIIPEIFTAGQLSHDSSSPGGGCNYPSYSSNLKVKIRIAIEYEFNKNSYGKVNKTVQVYTYPVNLIDGSAANTSFVHLDNIPTESSVYTTFDGIINPGTSEPAYHSAWNKINISKRIELQPNYASNGGSFTMKADQIHLTDGAKIGPGVTIKAGPPLPDRPEIQQQNESYVINFCNTLYQGNEFANMATAVSMAPAQLTAHITAILDSLSNGVIIYPNPSNGTFTISFEEPATSCQEIKILSSSNEILYENSLENNETIININMSASSPGFYYAKFYFQEGVITKRVWIQ